MEKIIINVILSVAKNLIIDKGFKPLVWRFFVTPKA